MSTPTNDKAFITIRPAQETDKADVIRLINSSTEWYRPIIAEKDLAEHAVDRAWADRNFALREFFVGRDGALDLTVGMMSFQVLGEYAYLGYVYVDTARVGRGYGQQLLDFAAKLAIARQLKGVALLAHPQATWAIKAYLKFGFTVAEREKTRVLAWNNGALNGYYEENCHLLIYALDH